MQSPDLQIHLGTYEGEIVGFQGSLTNIENYYSI
jgi:hypothetical protein